MELFLSQPVEIAIASLPDGTDPDEFLLARGAEAFKECLAQATDALSFRWKQLVKEVKAEGGLTSQQKAVQQYLETLAAARGSGSVDPIRWGQALARVSRLTEIPTEELNRQFKITPARSRPRTTSPQVAQAGQPKDYAPASGLTARQRAEGFILGLLFAEPGRWHKIQQELKPGDFMDEALRQIAEVFWQHLQDEGEPVFNEFLDLLSDAELKSVAVRWADEVSGSVEREKYLIDSLRHIIWERENEAHGKLMMELRRTNEQQTSKSDDKSADLDTLRKVQEKARIPDMKRVTL
jgi:DNA primase